ncbi:uncharacterized protein LOC125231485 [Leguminivora glycinivorella]|uniref:uncharacterized protein LOC125231485 n=1 Tax=Leguminivora glycinivorella TaxID=1035111 RepID=UPI00200D7CC2|nr:uncharacterized protein LOC125231485 [Leguminivora glycinivorella]
MSVYVGTLGTFDYKTQDWKIFSGRLAMFITLNDIADEKKTAVLLTSLSEDTYRLVSNLLHPKKIETSTYDEIVLQLNNHFTPKRSTFADRSKFYEAVKLEGESVEEWAARLRGLAVHCGFGTELNVLLLDRFVLGFRSGPERDKLCEQDLSTLTMAKALEIAQQALCARSAKASEPPAVTVKEEPLFKASVNRAGGGGRAARVATQQQSPSSQSCTVCGLKSHSADQCKYKNYRCNKCKNKGHLRKVCGFKVHNLGAQQDLEQQNECAHDCEECQLFSMRV